VRRDPRSGRKLCGFFIKLRKQSWVMSSAASTEPESRYEKRKIAARCRSYSLMKAAGSPAPAFSSKSSSVVLSGNRHSILQESLPTSITDKRLKDTPFPQSSGLFRPDFKYRPVKSCRGQRRIFEPVDARTGPILLKPRRWMHLEAKRLTTKYRASKMFCSSFH
jgi:hypothetical protein